MISQSLRAGWAMNIKYSVRPLKEDVVAESIFDTYNLFEALKKVDEQYIATKTRCVIVPCNSDVSKLPTAKEFNHL